MKLNRKFVLLISCLMTLSIALCACHAPKNDPTAAPTATEVPAQDTAPETPDENTQENNDSEEEPMIINPGRSSLPMVSHAASGPANETRFYRISNEPAVQNAQIVKPIASPTEDSSVMITNDHTVTYQQQPSVIQKSSPAGQLQPLSYIPPAQLANGQSISFGWGETSAVISGYVPAGGYVSYNLYAFANQNFLVLLSSDSGTSVISVSDVYGNVYLDANQRQKSHNMYLPRTATYYVNVHSTGYGENFTLQVFIPARVTIPAGKTSTVMSGSIGPYGVVGYTAYMYAGQTARIDDYSGARPTSFLRVSGLQTGVVYMDYTSYSPSWYSVVPATQDYLIEVISMDQPSNYQLTVDVR